MADTNVVRAVGIEPTLFSELDFESSASTSSATPAGTAIAVIACKTFCGRELRQNGR